MTLLILLCLALTHPMYQITLWPDLPILSVVLPYFMLWMTIVTFSVNISCHGYPKGWLSSQHINTHRLQLKKLKIQRSFVITVVSIFQEFPFCGGGGSAQSLTQKSAYQVECWCYQHCNWLRSKLKKTKSQRSFVSSGLNLPRIVER